MKILDNLRAHFRSSVINPIHPRDPALAQWLNGYLGKVPSSEEPVTRETALRLAAAYSCVTLIAETIAQLPVRLLRSADRSVATNHPLHKLISKKPNTEQNQFEFFEMFILNFLLGGRSVARIVRDESLRPIQLIPYPYPDTRVMRLNRGDLGYFLTSRRDNRERLFFSDEVLDLRGPTVDGVRCLTPVEEVFETFGIGVAQDKFGGEFYSKSNSLRAVLEMDGPLTDRSAQRLKTWKETTGGMGGVPVLDDGIKYRPIAVKPTDASLIEMKKLTRTEIAIIYRVPPSKIGEQQAGLANAEQIALDFVSDSIAPRVARLEATLNNTLLTDKEQNKFEFDFNLSALLRADHTTRATFNRTLWSMGALNANEIRASEGRPPIKDGERFYIPANLIPSDKIDEMLDKGGKDALSSPGDTGETPSVENDLGVSN